MTLLFSYGGADSREIQHLTGEDSEAHIKENFQDSQNYFQFVQNDCQLSPIFLKEKGLNQYRPQFTKAQTNNPLYQKHFLLRTELDGLLQLNTNIFFLAIARGSVQSNYKYLLSARCSWIC